MSLDRAAILARVAAHLAYLRDLGIRELRVPARARAVPAEPAGAAGLDRIRADLGDCQRCPLHRGRTRLVYGEGNPDADLVFVGEGPGRDEDLQGRPFVGRAGQLLTQILRAMGLERDQVYIANVVKCRPPDNRLPHPEEVETCTPFLWRQLRALRPKVVVTLGGVAAQTLLETQTPITRLRGRFLEHRGFLVLPTFHPAYLLRNPEKKREVWKDMQEVMAKLGLQPPASRRPGRS
ncbi:MAG: uracil-DNA glycosylase [Acidobacteria bacterium]|nr:uracil-DNA glycosylase [Acidobacteriota bacterium]